MRAHGQNLRTIWLDEKSGDVGIIDQRKLPHFLETEIISSGDAMIEAIRDMHLRGAIVIGVASAYAMYLAAREYKDSSEYVQSMRAFCQRLKGARPTAVNLAWAADLQLERAERSANAGEMISSLLEFARNVEKDELERSRLIGRYGAQMLKELSERKGGQRINILTHCNAGWLACVDYGTATAPIYEAHSQGVDLHVWVDETRPRNQGALTAWELANEGVPHTVIPDNTGGHLMQHGMVDVCITGTDRTTRTGDVANKIGTYLKALAAKANGVPFYVALPSSSFDFTISDGVKEIEVEERSPDEVRYAEGLVNGTPGKVLIYAGSSPVANFAFDVTPAGYVTGLISERGICKATEEEIVKLFPEAASYGR